MNVVELKRFDQTVGTVAFPGVFPSGDVAEVFVVACRFAVVGLVFLAEVTAARLASLERVEAKEFAKLKEVGDAAGFLKRLVDLLAVAQHAGPRTLTLGPMATRAVSASCGILPGCASVCDVLAVVAKDACGVEMRRSADVAMFIDIAGCPRRGFGRRQAC